MRALSLTWGQFCCQSQIWRGFAGVVKAETYNRGVDLIVDLVERDYFHRNMASAAMDSKMVPVAALNGSKVDDFDLRALLNKRIWLFARTLRTRDADYQGQLRDLFCEKILPHTKTRKVETVADRVYSLTQISDAHERLESNVNAGKIICVVNDI